MPPKNMIRDRFLFIGESRSDRAVKMGVTWEDGRLAASTLFRALAACGLDPTEQKIFNLFYEAPVGEINVNTERFARTSSVPVIAMGKKVSAALAKLGIRHHCMTHPAARGKIRKTRRYIAHVKSVLRPLIYSPVTPEETA